MENIAFEKLFKSCHSDYKTENILEEGKNKSSQIN